MRLAWFLIAGLAGCFTPPAGIRAAEQALEDAEAEGAAEYLPIEHAHVEDLLGSAEEELAFQERRSIHQRSYRRANRLLEKAQTAALRLKARAIARRAEVERMIVPEMQMLMTSVQAIEAVGLYDVDMLDRMIDQAADAARDRDFIEALILIRDAQSEADALFLIEETSEPGA
jgi:hypothetical protein